VGPHDDADFVLNGYAPMLEKTSIQFIQNSPFMLISSISKDGNVDISPKGGEPGFVRVIDENHLAFLDKAGNKKLHTVQNLENTSKVGLMFMIPGIGDFLRIYGEAYAVNDTQMIAELGGNSRENKLVFHVEITKVFPHCPAAAKHSKLWEGIEHNAKNIPGVAQMAKSLTEIREALE
jgi:predicted pyridoxine 5'-phosphate oxidase superfamily flavin-nucleotide-binding protein